MKLPACTIAICSGDDSLPSYGRDTLGVSMHSHRSGISSMALRPPVTIQLSDADLLLLVAHLSYCVQPEAGEITLPPWEYC